MAPGRPGLVAVRLERTREVLHELLRSVRRALPIVAGVAGPMVVAGLALLAWSGMLPMKAVTLPARQGAPLWLAQAVVAAWPAWALRARLLPAPWCVQLRCLPLAATALWASDVAVSAVVLAPLAALYAGSIVVFALQRPPWWLQAWPAETAALLANWLASCALGAVALAWQRGRGAGRARRVARARSTPALLARRPGVTRAILWAPWWREALVPGGASAVATFAAAIALAAAWTRGFWPAVPAAAWALAFVALLVALTERLQRALEAHLERLAPWLASLPLAASWRWRWRVLPCVPMVAAGGVAVALVLASRPWRGLPLLAFALGCVAVPAAMTAVPSARRETHVGLWMIGVGVLTALGSELWN